MKWARLRGSIYSVSTRGDLRNDKNGYVKTPTVDKYGYLTYNIQGKTRLAHRVVAEVFLDNYSEALTVNHINSDRKDNRVENLEMMSIGDNIRHASRKGSYVKFGETNNNCKYNDCKILTIHTYIESGLRDTEISNLVKIPRKYINDIRHGKIRRLWKK